MVAANADDLGSVPRTCVVKEKNYKLSSDVPT